MESIADLLHAMAALAWPTIVVIILFLFRDNVKEVIESAKSRKFTVRIAGNELTMDEISQQQLKIISDLQKQLVDLQERLESLTAGGRGPLAGETTGPITESQQPVNRILWVDDTPKENAYLIQSFREQGIDVVTALSTEEALRKFARGSRGFDRIITDMGRFEAGRFNPLAGIELTRRIRPSDPDIPIILFTNPRTAQEKREEAQAAGIDDVTASATALLKLLRPSLYDV